MTKMYLFLCSVLVAMVVSAQLPPKTHSEVCPALTFDQRVDGTSVYFIPVAPPNEGFKFVDLHIHLHYGTHSGPVVNYSMKKVFWEGKSVYSVNVEDPDIRHALATGNQDVMYSFTYCVGIGGKPVDCDTEGFQFEQVDWHAAPFPRCPVECGLPPSKVYRDVFCAVQGTGTRRSADRCDVSRKPVSEQNCPATEPCEVFQWRGGQVECPTRCGLPETRVPVPAQCVGNYGSQGSGVECGPKPADIICPATPPCVTYSWKALSVTCPTECGLPTSFVTPEVLCIGSDGINYPHDKCANQPMPQNQRCAGTAACVTFEWKAYPVMCPTDCGNQASQILPDVQCYGSDGLLYPDTKCANLSRPEAVHCAATPSCVVYRYDYDISCPTECGLPSSKLSPKLRCVGDDGSLAPLHTCKHLTKPIVSCPATQPCPKPNAFCPAITFRQRAVKTPGQVELYFVPTNPGAKRMRFDFVDVHYQTTGTPLLNHRMNVNKVNPVIGQKEGIEFSYVISEPEVNQLLGSGVELEYSFTYCIELTDCDTQTFYLTL